MDVLNILFYLTSLKDKDCKAVFERKIPKDIKPVRMGTVVYKIWNTLCDDLFNIYYNKCLLNIWRYFINY